MLNQQKSAKERKYLIFQGFKKWRLWYWNYVQNNKSRKQLHL